MTAALDLAGPPLIKQRSMRMGSAGWLLPCVL